MFKKFFACFLAVVYVFAATVNAFAAGAPVFDKSGLDSGVVRVSYDNKTNVKLKIMIQKQDKSYYYDLEQGDSFPLQFGNGSYTVAVLGNVSGNKYKILEKDTLDLELANENKVFLNSIKLVNWNENMAAVKKARELTKNAKTDMEKVKAIYEYVTGGIAYDDKKINSLELEYVPVVDEILAKKSGICYDYSVLYAAMLRSVNVPAKLVMGHRNDITAYHAWNQVYLKEQGKWITIDTTYDSTFRQEGGTTLMIKDESNYKVDKIY